MIKIIVTGINFKHDNGYENEYTSVDISFITSGVEYALNGPINLSKEDYQTSSTNNEDLKSLIKQEIINDLQV